MARTTGSAGAAADSSSTVPDVPAAVVVAEASAAAMGAEAVEAEASSVAAGAEASAAATAAVDSIAARRTIDSNHLGSDQKPPLERQLWSTGVSHDRQINLRTHPPFDSRSHRQRAARSAFARARRSGRRSDVRGCPACRRAGRLPDARCRRQCVRQRARDQRSSRDGKGAR
ncbi:hypothetical protein PCAR4_680053 [Paraburkholderia caribensis]|nr:hypothetical protein PCAR4_680053 [Paraburkholderia caribensis]